MKHLNIHFPRIGMRIIKSAAAVGICILIYALLGLEEIPFFLVIAALQGLQPYQRDVKEIAVRNVFGTLVGAFCALITMLLYHMVTGFDNSAFLIYGFFVTVGIAISIYSAVVMGHGDAAHFTAVVYLCIVMVHMDDQNSLLYVTERLVETLLGIAVGMGVNALRIPRRKVRDTLFVAALDDVLHSESSILPEYSKVELNRILDSGVRLSIITQHSSAAFWDAAGSIRFKMPIILLDGAVLYDPAEKRYLDKVELESTLASEISGLLADEDLSIFQSCVIDDSVINFVQHIAESSREIYESMRRSPSRNFIHHTLPGNTPVVYILCIGPVEKLDKAIDKLNFAGLGDRLKICRFAHEKEGMGYMRIFSREASRHKMLEKLRQVCGMEKLRSFGNDPALYDVCVRASEGESILKALRKEAEPFFWQREKKK